MDDSPPLGPAGAPLQGTAGWVRFPADFGQVVSALDSIKSYCQAHGVGADQLSAIELAAAEALNNAIEHGAGEDPGQSIFAQWRIEDEEFSLEVEDPSPTIPPDLEPHLPDDPLAERGRGTFLMHQLMDHVSHYLIEGRHRIRLTLRLLTRPTPPDSIADLEATVAAMAEDLSTSYENLSALFRLAEQLAYSPSFALFVESSLAELMELARADGAMVSSWSESGQLLLTQGTRGSLEFLGGQRTPADADTFEVGVALSSSERTHETGEPLPAQCPLSSIGGHLLGIPMAFADQPTGVLTLQRDGNKPFFSSGEINVSRTFTDFLSIAIALDKLQTQRAHEEIAMRELEIAADLQRRLLPETFPVTDAFAVFGTCTSARQVGGDYINAIPMEDGSIFLVIADVMGKGVPAAMLATIFRTALYARPHLLNQPDHLMAEIAGQLHHDIGQLDMFITAQMAYCDAPTRRIHLCSAGHCPALLWKGRRDCETLSEGGPPLGIFGELDYPLITRDFPVGSRLALITDGLYEVENEKGEWLDLPGLIRVMNGHIAKGGYAFTLDTLRDVNAFTQDAPPADDRSALVVDSSPDEDMVETQCIRPS